MIAVKSANGRRLIGMDHKPWSILLFVAASVSGILNAQEDQFIENKIAKQENTSGFTCLGEFIFENTPSVNIFNENDGCSNATDDYSNLCYQSSNPPNNMQCIQGTQRKTSQLCDGEEDCSLETVEAYGVHSEDIFNLQDFHCNSGQSINGTLLCNGQKDCDDESDETASICLHRNCSSNAFRCSYGACIEETQVCDGEINCVDGSDESSSLCGVPRPAESCLLPQFPKNGRHNIEHDTYIKHLEAVAFSCNHGYELEGDEVSICFEGNWITPAPTCKLTANASFCPGLKSRYLKMNCALASGEKYPCEQPAPHGSKASYSCSQFYNPRINSPNRRSICRNGKWTRELLRCVPVCGKVRGDVTPLIVHGAPASNVEMPWHVAMYMKEYNKTTDSARWLFQCGGSLINENMVLTAAHCVWQLEPQNIIIAIGKYYLEFEEQDQSELAQIKEVKELKFPLNYQHTSGNYDSDLALVILVSPVTLTSMAQPVCLDWEMRNARTHFSSQSIGTIVGWGRTENGTLSRTLRKANLPVISVEQCIKDLPDEIVKYVRSSTFCAGYRNGTSVCNGDSGGGLVFQKGSSWVVQGVVSVSPRSKDTDYCDPKHYAIFTKVSSFIPWIREMLEKYALPD